MRRERRKDSESDASPAVQLAYPDAELGHFRHPPFSIWSAMKYILFLSVILWWLPTFGQMIAGYVGGRRAGGPWRGVIAAIVPVALIVVLSWAAERGLLSPWLGILVAIPQAIGHFLSAALPPLAPYVEFAMGYLGTFVEALKATLSMGSNGYLVTIVFAYIGGILADQARRESATARGTSVGISISQPLLAPFRNPHPAWETPHPERFEDLRRIPVTGAVALPRAAKVDARAPNAGTEERHRLLRPVPAAAAKPEPKPEPKASDAHAKELATRKWVERALRQYEAAHRR